MELNLEVSPKQREFLRADGNVADEVLFGGAAGGGKSYGQIVDAMLYALKYPKSKQLILRRTFPDLERSIIVLSLQIIPQNLARYNASKHRWRFVNGSVIEMGYCAAERDVHQYQGAEYDVIRLDELTHFTEYIYVYLLSRLRGSLPYPRQMKASTNPGGVGHYWVKARFVDIGPAGEVHEMVDGETGIKSKRLYLPSLLKDNPFLLAGDANYERRLMLLPEKERRALLLGDWDVMAGHKEDSAGDSTIWYRNGGLDSLGEAQFTLKQGAVGVGAVSGRCFAHFGADSLVLSKSGVYAITHVGNEAVNERYAQLKSWFVNPRLCAEEELGEAVAVGFGGRYYLAVNGHVYVADTAAGSSYESRGGGYQYDWWYWEGVPVRVWYTAEDELMFGTADGRICALDGKCYDEVDGERRAIRCHWLTPVLDLGTRVYYKKIKNAYAVAEPYNRSCVKMAYVLNSIESEVLSRDMSVFDFADLDFGDLAFETDEAPRNVPSGAKAKKVMFIQFKLYNEPGKDFGLYGLSVLYTIGGKYKG